MRHDYKVINPACCFLQIGFFLHDSYIPQRYPSLQCWVIIPDSPTFTSGPPDWWERASYHAGHLSLKCAFTKSRSDSQGLSCCSLRNIRGASRCLCHKSNGQPMGSGKHPLSLQNILTYQALTSCPSWYSSRILEVQKGCPSTTNMLSVGSFLEQFTHGHMNLSAANLVFQVYLWLQCSMVPRDVSSNH